MPQLPLGMQVGLGAGHIVLDGDLPPPKRGHSLPIFGHVWPNGLMDEDATWNGAIGIGPGGIVWAYVRWGPPPSSPTSNFRRCLLRLNGRRCQLLLSTSTTLFEFFISNLGGNATWHDKGNHMFFPKRLADTHNINFRNPSTPLASAQQ